VAEVGKSYSKAGEIAKEIDLFVLSMHLVVLADDLATNTLCGLWVQVIGNV